MKRVLPILMLFLICVLSACGKTGTTGDIVLPTTDEISRIEIVNGDVSTATEDDEVISDLIEKMSTAKDTGKESVSDCPNGDVAYEIILEFKDGGSSKVFMYFESGDLFLEQPYQGIFSVEKSLADMVNNIK